MGDTGRSFNEIRALGRPKDTKDTAVHRMYLRYTGQVSDPDFRYSLREEARDLGLTGWVSPVTTRVVDLCVQGEAQAIRAYSQRIDSAGVRQGRTYDLAGYHEVSPVKDEEGFAISMIH